MYSHWQTFVVVTNAFLWLTIGEFCRCLANVITVVALDTCQKINNVRGITVVVSWMDNMACSRNVDIRVCSFNVAHLSSRLLHFSLPVDVTVCGKCDLMRMILKLGFVRLF